MTEQSVFSKLYHTDCSQHIEQKNGFSYLSWPFAVKKLSEADPEANWHIHEFPDPNSGHPSPVLATITGYFVKVSVTLNGQTRTQIHPILDNKNKPVSQPDAFHVNSSIQRCLVKAIALHGLGLSIYGGEDVPQPEAETIGEADVKRLQKLIKETETDTSKFLKHIGAPMLGEIKRGDQFNNAVRSLETKKAKLAKQQQSAQQQQQQSETPEASQAAQETQAQHEPEPEPEPEPAGPDVGDGDNTPTGSGGPKNLDQQADDAPADIDWQ